MSYKDLIFVSILNQHYDIFRDLWRTGAIYLTHIIVFGGPEIRQLHKETKALFLAAGGLIQILLNIHC